VYRKGRHRINTGNIGSTGSEHGDMHRLGEGQGMRESITINNRKGSGLWQPSSGAELRSGILAYLVPLQACAISPCSDPVLPMFPVLSLCSLLPDTSLASSVPRFWLSPTYAMSSLIPVYRLSLMYASTCLNINFDYCSHCLLDLVTRRKSLCLFRTLIPHIGITLALIWPLCSNLLKLYFSLD